MNKTKVVACVFGLAGGSALAYLIWQFKGRSITGHFQAFLVLAAIGLWFVLSGFLKLQLVLGWRRKVREVGFLATAMAVMVGAVWGSAPFVLFSPPEGEIEIAVFGFCFLTWLVIDGMVATQIVEIDC